MISGGDAGEAEGIDADDLAEVGTFFVGVIQDREAGAALHLGEGAVGEESG